MWTEHLLLLLIGIAAGAAVSGGTFAFIITIKIVPRLVGKSKTASHALVYENVVILGGAVGNLLSVFDRFPLPGGRILLILYGLCSGIFQGAVAITLAEILHVFPILFRRAKIKEGLSWVIVCFALGKTAGALYYFFYHLGSN